MEGEAHNYRDIKNLTMASSTNKRQRSDYDDEDFSASAMFTTQENFARFIIITSKNKDKPVTSLSPFVIEKQLESTIGTAKSVKKLKNETLLVETQRKQQTDNLLKMKQFFNLPVEVTEHNTLNSSKGIIRDKRLRMETEGNIQEYLQPQGVTHVKRFKVKKNNEYVKTNTLLLTFNTVIPPKSLKIFYEVIPVETYVPNPLRCFNCQKFGHHESNCPVDQGSVCERCGMTNTDHLAHQCKNQVKCVNCNENHLSRSSECKVWKKEKEIMKIKVTKRVTYPEARKLYEQQTPEFSFSKVVQSMTSKPETKTISTQYNVNDSEITESTKVIVARKTKNNQTKTSNQPNTVKNQTQVNTKEKQAKPAVVTDRMKKGSNDPIQNHNRFGALADDGAMDTDEGVVRPGTRTPRRLSPVKPPK